MTSQSDKKTPSKWRRMAVAGVASTSLAAVLTLGFGTATANADVLDDLAQEFTTANGAGPIANLLNTSLRLRAQGFKPKPGNYQAIENSLKYRPNQTPLINALQATVASQQKQQEEMTPQSSGGWTVGINQPDPNNPSAIGGFGVTGPNGVGIGIGGGSN
jgi:hypothetical protein